MTEQVWETSQKVTLSSLFHLLLLHFQSHFSPLSVTSPILGFLPFAISCHHLPHRHPMIHSPVVVDVGGCHCVAEVGPHLERITNKARLACNHTTVHRSLSFLSFSPSMSFFSFVPSAATPRSFPLQSLNPTIPRGLLFSLFMELSVRASVSSRRGRGSGDWGLKLL